MTGLPHFASPPLVVCLSWFGHGEDCFVCVWCGSFNDVAVSKFDVILASGHVSGNVDRQCSSSDVSCGGTVETSCGWARYMRDSSLSLLRVACSLEPHIPFGVAVRAAGPGHANTYRLEVVVVAAGRWVSRSGVEHRKLPKSLMIEKALLSGL
jgi:hypothetical protein